MRARIVCALLVAALAAPAIAASSPFVARLRASTHRPKVNALWPFTVTVTDSSGRPLAAVLHMQVLLAGIKVGEVDNGRRYRFVGTWHEAKGKEVTWPPASRGQRLVFEVVVTARGTTRKVDYWVQPR